MPLLSQKHARKIAAKFGVKPKRGRRHDIVVLYKEESLEIQYGISRSSKDAPHNHLPKQLKINKEQALKLANCTLSEDGYFGILRDKRIIE